MSLARRRRMGSFSPNTKHVGAPNTSHMPCYMRSLSQKESMSCPVHRPPATLSPFLLKPSHLCSHVRHTATTLRCEDDVEVRREAARLLFALSLNELNKLDVAGVGGIGGSSGDGGGGDGATAEVATDLVALARSDDPSCARSAVGALANLSENDATHERLLGWGAGFLSKLALENPPPEGAGMGGLAFEENTAGGESGGEGNADVGLVREVTRCLANLAGNYATHEKLLDGGAADALVGSLKREDAVTARFAALGLANLAGQVGGRGSIKFERTALAATTTLVIPRETIR